MDEIEPARDLHRRDGARPSSRASDANPEASWPKELEAAFENGSAPPLLLLRMHEALRESEQRLALILEQVPAVLWSTDSELRVEFMRGAGLRLLGRADDEVVGVRIPDLFGADDPDFLPVSAHRRALAGETVAFTIRWKDRIFDASVRPFTDRAGGRVGVIGVATDATERHETEARLEESEVRYRALFENSLDGVMLTSPGGAIARANPAACRMLGYSEEELRGLRREHLVDASDTRLAAALEERERTGAFRGELSLVRKDGTRVPAEISTRLFVDDAGLPRTSMVIRDVSERRRAEEEREVLLAKLENERRQLAEVFARSPSFLAVLRGADSVFELANDAFRNLVGPRALIARPVAEAVPEFGDHGIVQTIEEVRSTGKTLSATESPIRLRRAPDDLAEERFVSFVYQPILSPEGHVSGVLLHGVDATEQVRARRRAEAAAEEARMHAALLRTVVDALPVGVAISVDGEIQVANPALEEICGSERLRPEARRGWWAADSTQLTASQWPSVRAARLEEAIPEAEIEVERADGSRRTILSSAVPILGDQERVLGTVEVAVDITARKEAERSLLLSEARLREAQAAARLGHWEGDLRSDRIALSPELRRICRMGEEGSEASLESLLSLLHPEDRARVRALPRRASESGEPAAEEARLAAEAGEEPRVLWIRAEAVPRRGEPPTHVRGIVQDITERRRWEAHLLHAQKMEAIGRLAGGVAHDFNNILHVIGANASLLLAEVSPDHDAYEGLREIKLATDRAASLTHQLLVLSRRQVIQPRVLDPGDEVQKTARMLRRVLGEDIALEILSEARGAVRIDPGQLAQMLMNLGLNARDAMPRGGRLSIRVQDAILSPADLARLPAGTPPGPYVALSVEDTGVGMDPATQVHLFEPFYTTKEVGEGAGLGLATVYGIVQQAGGHILVDSERGRGSRFRILLPRAEAADDAGERSEPRPEPRRGQTILLAEDEQAVRRVAVRLLERNGYRVLEARNGEEALRLAADHPGDIALLLTDVVMPRMGGRELAERLVKSRPGMRLIFMSGYLDDRVLQEALVMSGAAFLAKPFPPEALIATVRTSLEGG